MKRQQRTHASLASSASNSARKGLQQYFTPEAWATALGAALPQHRRTIADLHCGDGSLVRGLANDTTREVLGCDLDPTATLGGKAAWDKALPKLTAPLRTVAHGDVLDLLPLLLDTGTRFDLLALNPPFSLDWPVKLLPEPLRKGLGRKVDSTHATLRMIPELLTARGEALLIANQNTLERLYQKFPADFAHVWLWLDLASFFPGVDPSLRVGVLYLASTPGKLQQRSWVEPQHGPGGLAVALDQLRRELFTAPCVEQPWEAERTTGRNFTACADEMERRRDPSASAANVSLATDGRIRTHVTAYQERSVTIPDHMADFLRQINRRHPLELTLQRGARLALEQAVACGLWTVSPEAAAAIARAIEAFDVDRAPLTPISSIQRIGWIDDAETLRCHTDLHPFVAGRDYPLSTETIEWKKKEERPRYHAGKRDKETVLVRGTDLRLTLHPPKGEPVHFIYNPVRAESPDGRTTHSLETLAAHFTLPEVRDITALYPERYAANIELLRELESLTPA